MKDNILKYLFFTVGSFFVPFVLFISYSDSDSIGLPLWRSLLFFMLIHLLTIPVFLLVSYLVIIVFEKLKLGYFYYSIVICCFFACYLFLWGISTIVLPYLIIISWCFGAVLSSFVKGRLSALLMLATLNSVLTFSILFVDEQLGTLKSIGIYSPTFEQIIWTRKQYVLHHESGIIMPYVRIAFYASEKNVKQVARHEEMKSITTTATILNSLTKKVVLSKETKNMLNKGDSLIWIADDVSVADFIKYDNYSGGHIKSFKFIIYDESRAIYFLPIKRSM